MNEPPAGLQSVQKNCIQFNQHPVFKRKARPREPQPKRVTALLPRSDEQKFPVQVVQQRTTECMKRLQSQAQRVNQLAAELESALLELKAIASDVNRDWRAIQATQEHCPRKMALVLPKQQGTASSVGDICEYRSAIVPMVQQNASGTFVVTSRSVDIFQAERDAALLAQTLRQRTEQKRKYK